MRPLSIPPLTLLLLFTLSSCGDRTADDSSLPPRDRAARFDAFAKEGMTYTEVAKAFPPSRFCFGVVDDQGKHIGGTSYSDYTPEKLKREMSSVNYDGITFQYKWSKEPLVFYEVAFTRE